MNLAENLSKIQDELRNRTYKVGKYREFYVPYPKRRLVMALQFRDRVVQWAIYRQIDPWLDKRYIDDSYGCRVGKGTLAAAQKMLRIVREVSRKPDAKEWRIVKCDVQKFFYRVDHETIKRMYAEICDEEWFMWLMETIIDNPEVPFGLPEGMNIDDCPRNRRLYDVGMPIGNLTSQETANLYLDKLDQWIKHELKIRKHVRYMDDFALTVKGQENARETMRKIADFLERELKLKLSRKSYIAPASRTIEFVGYKISPHGLRMRKKTARHIRKSLRHIEQAYGRGEIELDKALETMTCYRGMTKHCSGYYMNEWTANQIRLRRGRTGNGTEEDDTPKRAGRRFYRILSNPDGTVDIWLTPGETVTRADEEGGETGNVTYRMLAKVVRGVTPWDGLEADLRKRYRAWCDSAEVIEV